MVLDFSSINFDYNDHILLIHNIRPADQTAGVEALTAVSTSSGNSLDWADVSEAKGYYVYRSDKASGTFSRITSDLLTTSDFVDTTAKAGKTWYYRVVSVNSNGNQTPPANVSLKRV